LDLKNYLTERRRARIEEVLSRRTRDLILVLEGVHDPHNVAACLRTAEGLGLQEVHVIAPGDYHPHKKVSQGADKWLDIHRHSTPEAAADALRDRGYRLFAAALAPGACSIDDLDFTKKTAVVLGNEHEGVSDALQALCDGAFVIPMRGFTQSFNISVAAAITVYHATRARTAALGPAGDLALEDRDVLRTRWVELSVRGAALLKEELAAREEAGEPTGEPGSRV